MTEMATTTKTKLLTPIAVIVGGFAMLVVAAGFLLLRTPVEPTLNELTAQTITASDKYRSASSKSKNVKRADFIKVADKRIKKLRALITTNPEQVLAAAIPPATIANIPKELQPYTEQYVTDLKGSYGIITSDNFEKQTSKDWQVFNSEDGKNTYNLYPTGKLDLPPIGINKVTGTVSGVLIDSNLALTPQAAVIEASTALAEKTAAVIGPQNTLVVKVNFSDYSTTTPTTATLQDIFFNRTGTTRDTGSLNSYYQEVSYNKISVTGTAIGPYTINVPKSSWCDFDGIVLATIATVDPDVNFNQFQHLVVIAPFACNFGGIATLGKTATSTADGLVNLSWSMSNALDFNNTYGFTVATHEFGHQLGNLHASFLDCGSVSFGSDEWFTGCNVIDYGDKADVMGGHSWAFPEFNAGHRDSLGWLSLNNIFTLTPTATLGSNCTQNSLVNNIRTVTCTIEPIETCLSGIACRPGDPASTGLKAIRLLRSASSNTYLSIEYRQPVGFDASFIDSGALTNDFTAGAMIHLNYYDGVQTYLVDTTTSTADPSHLTTPSLLPGLTYTDPLTGVTITTLSATPSALTVRITTGKQDFTPPIVSLDTVPSGTSVVHDSVDLVAPASDPSGISKVEFYVAGTLFATDTTAPYNAHLDTLSYAQGESISIEARAFDKKGDPFGALNNSASAFKSITINHLADVAPGLWPFLDYQLKTDNTHGTVTVQVQNIGAVEALNVPTKIYISNDNYQSVEIASHTFPSIPAGGNVTWSGLVTLPTTNLTPGVHDLTVKVNPDSTIPEVNYGNNYGTIQIDTRLFADSIVIVMKGATPISGASVAAYDDLEWPNQIGESVLTDVNGQAKLSMPKGANVKYKVRYGTCQSNETGYAVVPHNETIQLPVASSLSFIEATGNPANGLDMQVRGSNFMFVCDNAQTGDLLYIQPGSNIRFQFSSGAPLWNNYTTPFYTTPVQVKFCVNSTGAETTCPSGGSPTKDWVPIDSGPVAN